MPNSEREWHQVRSDLARQVRLPAPLSREWDELTGRLLAGLGPSSAFDDLVLSVISGAGQSSVRADAAPLSPLLNRAQAHGCRWTAPPRCWTSSRRPNWAQASRGSFLDCAGHAELPLGPATLDRVVDQVEHLEQVEAVASRAELLSGAKR